MPKVNNTRRIRAEELLKRLENGPAYFVDAFNDDNPDEVTARRTYKMWSQSWIIDELKDLIPELRKDG